MEKQLEEMRYNLNKMIELSDELSSGVILKMSQDLDKFIADVMKTKREGKCAACLEE